MNYTDLLTYANIIFMIGSIPQIYTVYKDRDILAGYNTFGSILTAIGMILVYLYYYFIGAILAMVFATPQLTYWLYVSVVLLKRW